MSPGEGVTHLNVREDVGDFAAETGVPGMEIRFPGEALGLTALGVGMERLEPGARQPFAHRHDSQEEVYLVVAGAGRVKVDDEILDLRTWDAVRVPGPVWRCFEAGDEGMTLVVAGAPPMADPVGESEFAPGWWTD